MNSRIIQFLSNINRPRITQTEILDILNSEEISEYISNSMLIEDKVDTRPKVCEYCDSQVEIKEVKETLIIQCKENPQHTSQKKKEDYIIYRVNFDVVLNKLITSCLSCTSAKSVDMLLRDVYFIRCEINRQQVGIIFVLSEEMKEENLYKLITHPSIQLRTSNIPLILIMKDNQKNNENIENIFMNLPFGNLIYPIYLQDLLNSKIRQDIDLWINHYAQLKHIEDSIMNEMKSSVSKERLSLIQSVDTNPKYLLSFLTKIKIQKARKKDEIELPDRFEDLISIIFQLIYSSDIRFGGHEQEWQSKPDNIFIIHRQKGEDICGIVDTKLSKSADLSKEKTEKYMNYIDTIRKHRHAPKKKALIFVVIGTKSLYTIKEFYKRIERNFEPNEYCIILPIESLETILYVYLGCILKGRVNLSPTNNIYDTMTNLFDNVTLSKNKKYIQDSRLFIVEPKALKSYLEEVCKSDTSTQIMFKELFHDA